MLKNKKIMIGSFIFLSFIYILIFSMSTSPLYPNYYVDSGSSYSATTLLISKGLMQGLTPYKDLLGTNGPVIYFIESIGWIFNQGRIWVFILQIICLSVSLVYSYKTLNLFVDNKKSYILTVAMLIPIVATFGAGNNVEEFALPLISISMYIVINHIKNKGNKSFSTIDSMILGLCLGLIIFSRFNNMFPLLGIIFALMMVLKKDKLKTLCFIILGVLIIAVPCFVFYFIKGGINEMIYATFIFNAKTMLLGSSTLNEIVRKIIKCIPVFILLVSGLIYGKKENKNIGLLISALSLFSFIGLLVDSGYWRYYIIIASFLPLAIALLSSINKTSIINTIKVVSIIALIGIYIIPIKSSMIEIYKTQTEKSYIEDNKVMINWAKENLEEDEDIVLVDVPASFYLLNDIMPKNRLFADQSKMSLVDYDLAEEIQDYVYSTPTTQMIIGGKGWIYECMGDYVWVDFLENVSNTNLAIYTTEAEHNHDH